MVLYTGDLMDWAVKALSEKGLLNLWIPNGIAFTDRKRYRFGHRQGDLKAVRRWRNS